MKNINKNQLKKCIVMSLDGFTRLVENLTDGLQTVAYEDGVYLISTDKANEKEFADLMHTFLKCMNGAYKNGGLYVDKVVSKEEE